ncbi:hypothetical protein HK098_006512 [Nowakowskiella sp. JEL0407]|nr:hypothetical protein HK098_006512 [Nowakowskiella sp. JEL0407]
MQIPGECALSNMLEDMNIMLLVKGHLYFVDESAKFQKKLDKINEGLAWKKNIKVPEYEQKVTLEVGQQNNERVEMYLYHYDFV